MADSPYQLTPIGYQQPDFFGDRFKLKLDPDLQCTPIQPYLCSQLGWACCSSRGQIYNLGLSLPGWTQSISDSFTDACTAAARAQSLTQPVNQKAMGQAFGAAADSNVWDTLRDLVQDLAKDRFWQDLPVPGSKKNIVTGDQAGAGKIDPIRQT